MSLLLPAFLESGRPLEYSVVSWNDASGYIPKGAICTRISTLYSSDRPVLASPLYYLKLKDSSVLCRISTWHRVPSLQLLLSTPWFSQIVRLSGPTMSHHLCNFIISQQ